MTISQRLATLKSGVQAGSSMSAPARAGSSAAPAAAQRSRRVSSSNYMRHPRTACRFRRPHRVEIVRNTELPLHEADPARPDGIRRIDRDHLDERLARFRDHERFAGMNGFVDQTRQVRLRVMHVVGVHRILQLNQVQIFCWLGSIMQIRQGQPLRRQPHRFQCPIAGPAPFLGFVIHTSAASAPNMKADNRKKSLVAIMKPCCVTSWLSCALAVWPTMPSCDSAPW